MSIVAQGFGGAFYVSGGYASLPYVPGSTAARKKVLKPRADLVPLVDPATGRIALEWDRYFDYIDDVRLGGVLAPTLPEVHALATNAAAGVSEATTVAMGAAAAVDTLHANDAAQSASIALLAVQANTNADAITQTVVSVQAAALPGSGAIRRPIYELEP